jgi:hypothetical protein
MASRVFDTTHWALPEPSPPVSHHAHHAHYALSRRAFIGSMAGAAGAAVGASLLPGAALAKTSDATPRRTKNAVTLNGVTFHLTFFGVGVDPSSITDFNGSVGVADVRGTGTATNPDGSTETLLYDTDVRFMSGAYVGRDGEVHKGTFGFS